MNHREWFPLGKTHFNIYDHQEESCGVSACHTPFLPLLIVLYREGASIWHIKQLVMARIARVTLGVSCNGLYKPRLPDHRARQHHIVQILELVSVNMRIGIESITDILSSGSKRVRWAFETWIEKVYHKGIMLQGVLKLIPGLNDRA